MRRVFHIISHFDLGGAERVAANIASSPTEGIEWHVVEIQRGRSAYTPRFIAELKAKGVHVHRALMPDVRFHFLLERLEALLFPLRFLCLWLRWRPDVVHAHTEGPDMCVVLTFTLFPWLRKHVRLVRTIHNTRLWTGQPWIGGRVERFYQRHAVNVAISQSVLAAYQETYSSIFSSRAGSPGDRSSRASECHASLLADGRAQPRVSKGRPYKQWNIHSSLIYNGVPEVPQRPYSHLVSGKVNILFSGRFEPQKGIRTLIEVVQRVAEREDCPYYFHLFGDGSLREELVVALGGLPCVSISGPLFGLAEQLGDFDYMFMPSEFEGLSMVAIEASMAGLPNIINDAPGLGETLPEDWPLTVEGNDVEAFVRIFREVLPSADRVSLGRQAHDYVAARFSLAAMQAGYEQIYLDL